MREALEELARALGDSVRRQEPLAPYTSMRVGGPADLLLLCRTTEDLVRGAQEAGARGVPWWVLGGGCNVLVADAGIRGLVLVDRADQVRIEEDGTVWAEAGALIAGLAQETTRRGLAGLEWAAGLPGTVGGAVVGNAGAFGGDICSVLRTVTLLERDGTVRECQAGWLEFAYRDSRIKRLPAAARPAVLAATFGLQQSDPATLATRTAEILQWRRTRHPSGATMGSTFKNPPDGHAGRLIEAAGLKGYRIGGVAVSEQHANFLINTGTASAADVLALIRHVRAEVQARMGVCLELEVELVGEWGDPVPSGQGG